MGQPIPLTVSDLPPEVLSFIFLFNTSVDLCYNRKLVKILQDTTRYTSHWVCRQWRFLLLDNPIIWSRVIDFTRGSHLWTEELLRRAADCPLILVSRYGLPSLDVLARELEHVSQFGRYYVVLMTGVWPLLLDKLHQPAPYLEELTLRGCNNISQYTLPATIFSGNAPRLRRLWLQSCNFDEALPYLPQLTHLRESNITGAPFPSKKWLDILPFMPLLTVLELNNVDIGTHPSAAVHLPNLTKIIMTSSLRECSVFLSCLILPSTCGMSVNAQNAHPGTYFDVTAKIINQKLQFYFTESIGSDPHLHLHIESDSLHISNRHISCTGLILEPNTPLFIHFRLSWTSLECDLLSILPHVSSAFAVPLSHASSIAFYLINGPTSEAHSAVVDCLLQANKVTSLVLVDRRSAQVLLQLGRLTGLQTGKDVMFPSLRSIYISERMMRPYTDLEVLQPFVDFMRYRISISAPVQEIYYTTWDDDKVECLKEAWRKVFNEYSIDLVYYGGRLILHGEYGVEKPG